MAAIFHALRDNNLLLLEKLLEEGHKVNSRDPNDDHRTVLHKACIECNPAAVKLILKYNPKINLKDKLFRRSPLQDSCFCGDLESVVLLLDSGADINTRSINNHTPLYQATRKDHLKVVRVLLSRGADPKIIDIHNISPLQHATSSEVVKMLVDFGADIHATDRNNDTPLIDASGDGRLSAVEELCKLGSDINHRGRRGRTAIHQATERNQLPTVKYLLTLQPDVSIRDDDNLTVLGMAKQNGYKHIEDIITAYIKEKTNIKGLYHETCVKLSFAVINFTFCSQSNLN